MPIQRQGAMKQLLGNNCGTRLIVTGLDISIFQRKRVNKLEKRRRKWFSHSFQYTLLVKEQV